MHKAGDFIFALHLTDSESVPYFPMQTQVIRGIQIKAKTQLS